MIPSRTHGILDYLMGVLLIAAPWIIGFSDDRAATMVPVVLGAGVILYSLLTDYELGAYRVIPLPTHLAIDVVGGILLAASPWLFGFADRIVWPHVTFGLLEIGAALLTARRPSTAADHGHGRLAHR
ncbi:MAG TPA: SPW repeat protein [Tepidisphaeraceae bacterium]|nr:SPW repeat protein [Tepidisphaeraceae bacterium]